MSMYLVAVKPYLALLVLAVPIRDDLEIGGRPPPTDPILGLRILHQPVHSPLKLLLLSHVEVLSIFGLHLLI
jgi:hypothetical protein